MLVIEKDHQLLVINQTDHALLAGELLSLWQRDEVPAHPRREALLFAIREHDNGWREADAAPRVDLGTGTPYDFLSYPAHLRLEVWRQGVHRHVERQPYASALIIEHARHLHRGFRGDPEWDRFLKTAEEEQGELLLISGRSRQELESDWKFLRLADALSLAACGCRMEPEAAGSYSVGVEPEGLRLEPFPLVGSTTLNLLGRRIPNRPYAGDADLGTELARAFWERFPLRFGHY